MQEPLMFHLLAFPLIVWSTKTESYSQLLLKKFYTLLTKLSNFLELSLVTNNLFAVALKFSRPQLGIVRYYSRYTSASRRLFAHEMQISCSNFLCRYLIWPIVWTILITASFWNRLRANHHQCTASRAEISCWF